MVKGVRRSTEVEFALLTLPARVRIMAPEFFSDAAVLIESRCADKEQFWPLGYSNPFLLQVIDLIWNVMTEYSVDAKIWGFWTATFPGANLIKNFQSRKVDQSDGQKESHDWLKIFWLVKFWSRVATLLRKSFMRLAPDFSGPHHPTKVSHSARSQKCYKKSNTHSIFKTGCKWTACRARDR